MLETIFQLLDGFWTDFKSLISPILKLGFWLSGLGLLFALIPQIASGLDTIHSYLASANTWVQSTGFDIYYSKVNAIVPLTEVLAMLAAILVFQGVTSAIRMVKACIPTAAT